MWMYDMTQVMREWGMYTLPEEEDDDLKGPRKSKCMLLISVEIY